MDTGLDHTYMDFKLTSDRDFCLLYPVPNAAHEYFWGGSHPARNRTTYISYSEESDLCSSINSKQVMKECDGNIYWAV